MNFWVIFRVAATHNGRHDTNLEYIRMPVMFLKLLEEADDPDDQVNSTRRLPRELSPPNTPEIDFSYL